MVISNKNLGNRRVELIEGENMDNFLEMGELHYFKINTKNKRSPLRVSIKCFKGKIRSYASRTNTMPSEAASDQAFKTYDYEIADPGLKFKGDTMNLGLHAVTDANYSIVIHFGRNKDFGIPFLRNELQGNEDLQPGVSQIAKEMQKDLEIYRANMLSKRNSKSCTNIENLHKQLD